MSVNPALHKYALRAWLGSTAGSSRMRYSVLRSGMPTPVRIAVLGAGNRATGFSNHFLRMPHRAVVAAVADPVPERRERLAATHGIRDDMQFSTWEEFFEKEREIDAVLVGTMDRDHVGPAVATLEAGYHLLLEKPMATSLDDIITIATAARQAEAKGQVAGVVHPLRYGPSFEGLREVVRSGRIGRLITMDHLEGVGWWHQAHSFVRGNWGNEARATFMLLAKSCHDIDYICHLVGKPVARVSSFGSLSWFRPENAPEGSTERCLDCPLESTCEYSAVRHYVATDRTTGFAKAISVDHSEQAHLDALRNGPYGRCVWRSDNDVVDHQVISMEFADQSTATMTMTAFSQRIARRSRLHGTKAEVEFDQDSLTIRDFSSGDISTRTFGELEGSHAGADVYIANGFVSACETGDQSRITTTIAESTTTHLTTFAAEEARRTGTVINVADYAAAHRVALAWPT